MAFLITLPVLIIALCLLYALVYSSFYERDRPLFLKPKYRKQH